MMSLEALAAEMMAWADNEDHGEDVCTQLVHWSEQLRAYLAARPASDLEQRMRARAAREQHCSETAYALLLEGADALAAKDRTITWQDEAAKKAIGDQDRLISDLEAEVKIVPELRVRIAELESTLTDVAEVFDKPRSTLTTYAELVYEARVKIEKILQQV